MELRREAQTSSEDGTISSRAKRKGSPCQQEDNFQDDETQINSGPSLPEVWRRVDYGRLFRDLNVVMTA
ncbi:hypothetical protein EJB05_08293 [Eragrostis curvula]|uniref:Uncharacterized protein n=1 Tax=Eragrostis curvula TaxID=38414 RepID=A0A5J9WKN0_9POAL|nr:hypothetical protein EJB05_08293 [Eragrostis curvula]